MNGIYTRNTVRSKKNNGTDFFEVHAYAGGLESNKNKRNACIQSIYREASGALRCSNEMRCFGMHGDRGGAQKKRPKKNNNYLT